MKKFLAITLSVLMILTVLPFSAFATVAETDVAKIGDTGYATLDAAVTAAADGDVITLLKDADLSVSKDSGSYTIDGSNRAYTVTLKAIVYTKACDITLKGCKIITNPNNDQNTRFEINNGQTGDLVFDNCLITSTEMGIKHCGYGNITLKNNTLLDSSSPNAAIYFRGDHADATADQCNFTLEDSTIRLTKGSTGNVTNASVLHFNANVATYKLNLRGNSVIENASEHTSFTVPSSVVHAGQANINGKLIINSDATAKLVMSAKNVMTAEFVRVYTKDGKTFATEFNGDIQLVTCAEAAAKGVILPKFDSAKSADGSKEYSSWTDGTAKYDSGALYTGAAVVTFTASEGKADAPIEYPCTIGDVGYNSLEEAYAAVKDGETIVLHKDVTLTTATTCPAWAVDSKFDPLKVGSVTIDGKKSDTENYTITVKGAGYFGRIAHYNLTMKNVDVVSEVMNPFQFEGYYKCNILKQTTVFENCNFTQLRGKDGCIFKVTGNGTGATAPAESQIEITFKNCTAFTNDAVMFLIHHGSNFTFNFVDSEFTYAEKADASVGNSMFNVFHCGSVVFNIDKDTVLSAASGVSPISKAHNHLFNVHDMSSQTTEYIKNRTVTVNLEEGATLKLDSARTDNRFFNGSAAALTINDNGAKWVATPAALAGGVRLPALSESGAWIGNGEIVAADEAYVATATTDVEFKLLADDAFTILNGAGYKEGGMAFGMSVSNDFVEVMGENAEYGILVAPSEYTMFGFDLGSLNPGQYIELTTNAAGLVDGAEGRKNCILGFDGIPTNDANAKYVELSAIGFIRFVNAAGDTVILYTSGTYAISYAELAAAAVK